MRDFSNSEFLEESALQKNPPALVSPRIAAAMTHPTRIFAMKVLFERTASPREIATEMDEPVNNVTYHVKRLLELGCIELVSARPARGGRVVEHFYRATSRVLFDDDVWQAFGEKEKADVTTGIMRLMSGDINEAMIRGTFYDPDDNHLSRSPMVLDPEGWREVNSVLDEAMERLMAIQDRVIERRSSEDEGEQMHTRVHMIHFRSPTPSRARPD
jgi:DNA-binding transcriptional ArsR family regulator